MNDGTAAQRLAHLDALRGFALFGILVVNIGVFASVYYGTGLPDPAFSRPLDQWVNVLVAVLFESKFYLLFSFLFGYSFTWPVWRSWGWRMRCCCTTATSC
ncbi:Predicted membrane protein [Bordetella pertussis]|nr:Predicted membrane protein [Bordetella pertussis]